MLDRSSQAKVEARKRQKTIPEQSSSDPVDWQIPDGEYSYQAKVSLLNQAELRAAQNAIITEQEAENLLA